MRVGVNARALSKPNPAGVSRYTANLATELAKLAAGGADLELVLFGVDGVPPSLRRFDRVESADAVPSEHSGLRAHAWEQLSLPRTMRGRDVDVFLTPAGHPPLLADVPLVTTIHDVSPVTHPEWYSRGYSALYRTLTPLTVRRSDRIVTVSSFSKAELTATYPAAAGKTVTVYNGLTPLTDDETPVDALRPGEFLLFVGGANPRKNVETLVEAYRRYRRRADDPVALALAGPDRSVFAGESASVGDGVHALGYVPDESLAWLYRNARAFVLPSVYEGFGLPILEAMSAGTPVVTSDWGAMREIADGAACLVDANDPVELADALEAVLTDESYRRRLAARGRERAAEFSWERTAREMLDVLRDVG